MTTGRAQRPRTAGRGFTEAGVIPGSAERLLSVTSPSRTAPLLRGGDRGVTAPASVPRGGETQRSQCGCWRPRHAPWLRPPSGSEGFTRLVSPPPAGFDVTKGNGSRGLLTRWDGSPRVPAEAARAVRDRGLGNLTSGLSAWRLGRGGLVVLGWGGSVHLRLARRPVLGPGGRRCLWPRSAGGRWLRSLSLPPRVTPFQSEADPLLRGRVPPCAHGGDLEFPGRGTAS